MVLRVFLVAFGGALGTLARYSVGLWATRTYGASFPYGTLIVNLVGCFLIALVAQLAASTSLVSPTLRLTLTTGFIGGLTTYSSFNLETTNLLRERGAASGFAYLGLTLFGCFAAGLLGLAVAKRLADL